MTRTLTRPMFRKGGMAQREKYMGGGMTGIMSGIVPDAGVTPRVGLQEGTFIRGGGVTQGPPFSTRGIPESDAILKSILIGILPRNSFL